MGTTGARKRGEVGSVDASVGILCARLDEEENIAKLHLTHREQVWAVNSILMNLASIFFFDCKRVGSFPEFYTPRAGTRIGEKGS